MAVFEMMDNGMTPEVQAVLEGEQRWAAVQGDCLSVLADLPPDICQLCFGSPPYVQARLYLENGEDLGIARGVEEWVMWMVEIFAACRRVCVGLTGMVVEGQTKDFSYDCAPDLLRADLRRGGFTLRKSPIYRRVGIPGSGGPDWLRNDTESIVCVTRGGRLPWSDNTAMGSTPKWAPGGKMSHRLVDGTRKNGREGRIQTDRKRDGHTKDQIYTPPEKANPGNVVYGALSVGMLTDIISHYVKLTKIDSGEVLRTLRRALDAQAEKDWLLGIYTRVLSEALLQPLLCEPTARQTGDDGQGLPLVRQGVGEEEEAVRRRGELSGIDEEEVLRPALHGELCGSRGGETSLRSERRTQQGEAEKEADQVRKVRERSQVGSASQGQRPDEQRTGESGSSLRTVSQGAPQGGEAVAGLLDLWSEALRTGFLQQALPTLQKVWQSVCEVFPPAQFDASSIVSCNVGGGRIGSLLAHSNEAPFPEDLARFFIKSFCPPGGLVIDPFCGSGTTVSVAVQEGRRAIGIDLRQSQVDLTKRRLSGVTPSLFGSLEPASS